MDRVLSSPMPVDAGSVILIVLVTLLYVIFIYRIIAEEVVGHREQPSTESVDISDEDMTLRPKPIHPRGCRFERANFLDTILHTYVNFYL